MNTMETKWKPASIIGFTLLFSFLLLSQMGLFIAHELWGVELKWNLFQYCLSVVDEASIGHAVTKLLFFLVILYTVTRILWRVLKQWYLSVKWECIFEAKQHSKLTKKLNYKYRHWNVKLLVVNGESFTALTMGLVRPRIIVSTAVFTSFSAKELEVILQHERYHCIHHDPLKIFLSTLLVDGLGYVPMFKAFHHYYKTLKEVLADRFVMRKTGSEYDLGNVLLRLSRVCTVTRPEIGVSFADTAINYRIHQVLYPEKSVHIPFFRFRPTVISMFIVLILPSIVLGGCS